MVPPAYSQLSCPVCRTPWIVDPAGAMSVHFCPGCGREATVAVFPALARPVTAGVQPEKLVIEGEASCFYHADKRAAVPCSACGRFLCTLCDVVVGERHLCPACIEAGRAKGKFVEFETARTLWDSAALMLAVLPLILCFYATLICAPIAIVVAIMGWKKPSSIIPRGRWRLWVALIVGLLEIAGWAVGAFFLVRAMSMKT